MLLEVNDLRVHFLTNEGVVKAVDGVNLTIERGKTLCLVGESGCGKSVTARAFLQIISKPGKIVAGSMRFHQKKPNGTADVIDLATLDPKGPAIAPSVVKRSP
jgi:ABC-type dipeptide/oligopeptide/nickel transport system ATPase component